MTVSGTTARRLQVRLAHAQRSGRLPSVVAGLVRDGELVWAGRHGDHVGSSGPDPFDVQYRLGSITKTFTTVLVHRLVVAGRLGWDDPVGGVLGDFGYADRTVQSLLSHRAGLPAEPTGDWWEAAPGRSWPELVAATEGAVTRLSAPGQFHYSNLGFAILGQVVERLTGRPWWASVEQEILEPLGMGRTTYLPVAPAARGYSVHPYADTLTAEPATDTGAMAPAGQAWAPLGDLARWACFVGHGHPEVLGLPELQAAAHLQAGDRHDLLEAAQGLGFMVVRGGSGLLVGHTGSMPGFLAACFADRGRGTGVAVLANATTGLAPQGLAAELLDVLEECEPTVVPAWTPAAVVPPELRGLLGVWHWGNTPVVLRHEAGTLVVTVNGVPRHTFVIRDGQLVGDSGYHTGETARVVRTPDGSVSRLEISTFVFTREPSGSSPT